MRLVLSECQGWDRYGVRVRGGAGTGEGQGRGWYGVSVRVGLVRSECEGGAGTE